MALPMVRIILVVFAIVRTVLALSCASCDKTACVEPLNCKAGLVKGLCGCCDVCAKLENERCGGPWSIHGKCAERLKCVTRTQLDKRDRFLPEHFKTGVCEPDACQNKTCGFRQKCKINRRGDPVCVCPRRCGKAKNPVCGLLNGKQYRNKCKLQREECLTKTKIGLIAGECKRCTHSGNVFKFGDSRPDAKPCETCTCHHGLWKCDIRPSCFLNNLPIRSDHPSCLVSQDRKIHVLPCPRGFSCRVSKSDNIHDSFRVGVCKPKKAKKPNEASQLVEVHNMNNIFESDEEGLSADTFAERRMPAESEYRKIPDFTEMNTTPGISRSTSVPTVQLRNDQQLNGGLMTHVCLAYPDKRSCSSITSIRWYYNATTRSCVQFSYGGCGGNFNNFLSMETCQEVCQSGSHPTAWPSSTPTEPSPIYLSTQRRGHHETSMLLDMCHDMKSGMSYRNGERWHVDACTSCSCVSGRALCVAATCPITCLNPVHIEGKCCPICKIDLDDEIIVEGKETRCKDTETELWYHSGESWSKDNCTKCVCFEGEISCMASVCSKPFCSNPVKKEGICCPVCPREHLPAFEPSMKTQSECRDQSTGKLYLSGEGWNINDCVSCFCGKDGHQVCHKSNCSVLQCKNPVHLQGRCCPVCPEAFHSACIYDNRQYFQGDFMLLRDMCTLCKCRGNMWNCTMKYCSNGAAKDIFPFPFELKPTAPYRKDTTSHSGFYIKEKKAGNIPTESDSDKREDYIIEDPFRMTRWDMKNSNTDDDNENEIKKVLAIMLKNRLKTTRPMSTDGQNHWNNEHKNTLEEKQINNEDSSWTLEPTKKATEEATLPWFRDFNNKMWSAWDEPEYIDHVLEEKNATGV